MAQAPTSEVTNTAPELGASEGASIASQLQKATQRRQYLTLALSGLVAGASFSMANKRMATNKAILVGLVLGVVSYFAAGAYLPKATSQNYGV